MENFDGQQNKTFNINEFVPIEISENDPAVTIEANYSQGKGGQNVNKNMTRAVVYFDYGKSTSLTDEEKQILACHAPQKSNNEILNRVCNSISAGGVIKVESQESKSFHTNKQKALEKLSQMLTLALKPKKERKTALPKKAKGKIKKQQKKQMLAKFKKKKQMKDF